MEKKYFVFCGMNYYPNGGMNDFIGRFETMQQAGIAIGDFMKADANNTQLNEIIDMYWYHIYDIEKMKIIFNSVNDSNDLIKISE